jgi:hypothetical protein
MRQRKNAERSRRIVNRLVSAPELILPVPSLVTAEIMSLSRGNPLVPGVVEAGLASPSFEHSPARLRIHRTWPEFSLD